jgi:lysophospholipase L1-like esterase
MRRLRTGCIIVLITLGLFLALELMARIMLWRPERAEAQQAVGFGFSRSGYGDLLPNLNSVELVYPGRPYRLQTNSAGLRNIDEINADPAIFRVLAIGDSFTYGYYVHNQEAWPARLEETLNQRLKTRFQVFNAGVPGYTIEDELGYLRDKGLALEPKLVVLGVYTNDVFDFYPEIRAYFARPVVLGEEAEAPPTHSPLGAFLQENSALYNVILRLRSGYSATQVQNAVNRVTPTIPGLQQLYRDMIFLNPNKPEYQQEWNSYERLFMETVDLLQSKHIPLVVVAFPDLAQLPNPGGLPDVPQRFMAQITSESKTPFVDMLPIFRQSGDIQSLYLMYYNPDAQVDVNAPDAAVMMYSGDGHPSPYGHLVIARSVAHLLIEEGLVGS